MKNNLVIWLTTSMLLIGSPAAYSEYKPYVGLFSYFGEREITLSAEDSLLFTVSIENAAARTIRRANKKNQSLLAEYAMTEEFQALSKKQRDHLALKYPVREVPILLLGSNSVSAESLISIQARNKAGEAFQINARPVKSSQQINAPIAITEEQPLEIHFIVESEELKRLQDGSYSIAIALQNNQHSNMWQGWAYSNPMQLNLHRQHPEPNWALSEKRARLQSTYLILDQQYIGAEDHARDWIKRKPETISGWIQLGEALIGQNKNSDALDAFNSAEAQFRLKYGNQPRELPEQIIDRINTLTNLSR